MIGCGDVHNEAAWAKRLPQCYRFLLNLLDERNTLAHQVMPPVISNYAGVSIGYPSLSQWRYRLECAANPGGPWTAVATNAAEILPWASRTFSVTNDTDAHRVYRIIGE